MNGERLVEELVEADLGDVSADQQPSPPWSDAERDTVVRLAEGDSAAFLARAREDPGLSVRARCDHRAFEVRQGSPRGLAKTARSIEG